MDTKYTVATDCEPEDITDHNGRTSESFDIDSGDSEPHTPHMPHTPQGLAPLSSLALSESARDARDAAYGRYIARLFGR